MNEPGFSLREAVWPEDARALRAIRRAVFVAEQGVPEALEWDGLDREARHLLALDHEGAPIGCARLLGDGQIGRVAVLAPWRGRGVGSALLRAVLQLAREDPGTPYLHAQCRAAGFYRRHGLRPRGEVFMEAGIPHQTMVLPCEEEPT